MPGLEAGRMFLCGRCRTLVVLCSHCDRGNVYCGQICAKAQRRSSLLAAGARYQSSFAGRMAHAARARRYRARHNKVTHQGSVAYARADQIHPSATASPPLKPQPDPSLELGTASDSSRPRCSGCGAARADAVRQGWLRRWPSRPTGVRHADSPWSASINDPP